MDLTSAQASLKSLSRRINEDDVERASNGLLMTLDNPVVEINSEIANTLFSLLQRSEWECQATALCVSTELMKNMDTNGLDEQFQKRLSIFCEQLLEHREPRVRTCVVKSLEQLCRLNPVVTWERFIVILCRIVDESFVIDESERAKTHREIAMQEVHNISATHDAKLLAHETIGWKALETSLRGLESLIKGILASGDAASEIDVVGWNENYLINLVAQRSLLHENRYVREVGFDLCACLSSMLLKQTDGKRSGQVDEIVSAICKGLEDNWSQVRFAASVAARNVMVGLKGENRTYYFPLMLPRMCLNRYYLAEGVKIYSQESWKMMTGDRGAEYVAQVIEKIVPFYCAQSRANNHAVREAACHCIAELATKVQKDAVSPHVELLLGALVEAFHDDSWPVRDAACIATGKFVCGFPEESISRLDELFELWHTHLSDNIWSVREDTAVSLGHVMTAYPDIALAKVHGWMPELLGATLSLPAEDPHHSEHNTCTMPPSPPSSPRSMAGAESQPRGIVTGKLSELRSSSHAHDHDKHSNQQMYSCGSLAPKLKRRGVGCMDHGYSRPKRPWEITDGGIYLLRELCVLHPTQVSPYVNTLVEVAVAATRKKFEGSQDLLVTLWKQLILIAKACGKRPFKVYLEGFLPPMIHSLESGNQLVVSAAAQCLQFLMDFLGSRIVVARIEGLLEGSRLLHILRQHIDIVQ